MEKPLSLDADDLILFAQVVAAGGFSRAAKQVDLPKSTISRRIAMLEATLGERLLLRSTRRLSVTEFGEGVLEHGQRLLAELNAVTDYAQLRQQTPQGRMRVSLPPEFEELELLSAIRQFMRSYPLVQLEIDVSSRRVDLRAERFDLAVRMARQLPDDASLVARQILEMNNGLYASPAYLAAHGEPEAPDDLLTGHVGLPLIGSDGQYRPWELIRGDERWEGIPSGPVAANSIGLQSALAVGGAGIFSMSDRFAQPWVAQGQLQRVLAEWSLPPVTAWAVTTGRRLLPPHTRVFIELLRELLVVPPDV
jgi:DNA-binding transcriptional LysR family regulator